MRQHSDTLSHNSSDALVVFSVLTTLIAALALFLYLPSEAQSEQHFMYIRNDWDWYCVDELPYQETGEQTSAELVSLVERLAYQESYAFVIQVESCNLDMLLLDEDNRLYVWKFTSHESDAHLDHNMTRGASWAQLITIDFYPLHFDTSR